MIYGNPEKDRKPVAPFVREVGRYPGLLEIIFGIEGLVNKRSSHASGVIMFDEDPYEFGCFMKTPKGEIITQYDLHMCEAAGMTKYDFLVTEAQDKITECIRLLKEYNEIDSSLTLREVYDRYLHPDVIDLKDNRCWEALQNNRVLNVFQFDSDVGSQAAKKIKPTNILEMSDANGLMRLMTAEKGEETPMEKYIRFKENIGLWYVEMAQNGLSKEEMSVIEPYFKSSYGVPPSQEQLMRMLMDENICNFTLAEANMARKVVGKKQMDKIPMLKNKVLTQAKSSPLGEYIWKYGAGPQMGYSFSIIHALAYSFIGYQTVYLATNWNPIYWNTSCLIINSAALENEDDDVDKSTDYAKLAKAIGEIRQRGIRVSLADINNSGYSFKPDAKTNEILFGLKGLNKVGKDVINTIIENRPYSSLMDFMAKTNLKKPVMISLIKAGAFDALDANWACKVNKEPRKGIMAYYLSQTCNQKNKLTLQNFNGLMNYDLLPDELTREKITFKFNKFLKNNCSVGQYYVLNDAGSYRFYSDYFDLDQLEVINGITCIEKDKWKKIYDSVMDTAKQYIIEHQQELLQAFNRVLFKEQWDKYAQGSISAWEMEAMCFYYHEHELAHINKYKYGIVNFFDLPTKPEVEYFWQRGQANIPIYKTFRIVGTVISKNDSRSSISLLTPDGVTTVKMTREYYAMFSKRISEIQANGKKKIVENGWFTRGTKLLCTGYRRDDMFITKTYKNTGGHQLYLIEDVLEDGDIYIRHDRV